MSSSSDMRGELESSHPLDTVLPASRSWGLGLQGRLTLSFVGLITVALASSCWVFAQQSSNQLTDLMGQQARTVAYTLSQAVAPAIHGRQEAQLQLIGKELLNTRNVLYVAFLDADRKPLALSRRYVDFKWDNVRPVDPAAESLYAAQWRADSPFGEYVDVVAPVSAGTKRVGYVAVGVSLDREQAQLRWINWMVAAIGAVMVLISLPVAYLVVYGIFKPIRHLVDAARKIAAGRSDYTIHKGGDGLIGELSQSFEDMVGKIRRQRQDLADANHQLHESNTKLNEANEQLNHVNRQLADINRDLEDTVQQRTAQLETANKRLSGEISEKEDFLRAVSHDLNAPLRNISGMASMLLMKHRAEFNEDVIHRLERIQKNVQVETDLISELLELSRIKTRRHTMERVDIEGMVSDLAGVFEEDLQSRQIALLMETPLPPLVAERARLRQVFQNLIDNAIKYMGDGPTKEIRIGCVAKTDEAEFYVRDTGIGIEPEEVEKVFHVFRRGKNAAAVAGKGVGLASVKSIVEMYAGTIWVESKLGEGTTFKFTINGKYVEQAVERKAA